MGVFVQPAKVVGVTVTPSLTAIPLGPEIEWNSYKKLSPPIALTAGDGCLPSLAALPVRRVPAERVAVVASSNHREWAKQIGA